MQKQNELIHRIDEIEKEKTSHLDHKFEKYAKKLIEKCQYKEALEYLEHEKEEIWSTAIPLIKYKILVKIASVKFKLNLKKEAGILLIEASSYNPEDPKKYF